MRFYIVIPAAVLTLVSLASCAGPAAQEAPIAQNKTAELFVPVDWAKWKQAADLHAQAGEPAPETIVGFTEENTQIPFDAGAPEATLEKLLDWLKEKTGKKAGELDLIKFTLINGEAKITIGAHVDGWAGVSAFLAEVEPVIEKTLKQFPEVTKVTFGS